jgi:DNA replicative helicase MCM subunit Mcm2 (Cdc46/Mcm family)
LRGGSRGQTRSGTRQPVDERSTARTDEQDVAIRDGAEGVEGGHQLPGSIECCDEDRLEPARQRHR